MYSLASGIYQSYFAPPELSILILGLEGSGKTAFLERVKVTNISTQMDVSASASGSPSLSSSLSIEYDRQRYSTRAVAGVDLVMLEALVNRTGSAAKADKSGRGDKCDGKPARLPPPLPPKQAEKSRKWVDSVLDSERKQGKNINGVKIFEGSTSQSSNLDGFVVPPLPLCDLDTSENSVNEVAIESKCSVSALEQSRNVSLGLPAQRRRNSLIQMLRCPSSQRYYSSALNEEDDEEYIDDIHASAVTAISSTSCATQSEVWNSDYLHNYYVNYQETEEFDVKMQHNSKMKMFPLNKIRPTLGQNLAKLDLCGCKCSLFDLSGAEKMRPLWERYYRDTDAIVYVVNSCDSSFSNLQLSRNEYQKMCENKVLQQSIARGLPILIFLNKLDLAYQEYDASIERSNKLDNDRTISWNREDEDNFVGVKQQKTLELGEEDVVYDVSKRAIAFSDLVHFFGLSPQFVGGTCDSTSNKQYCSDKLVQITHRKENIFLFGGSAKSGEGVRAAMEYLISQSRRYHVAVHS